MPISHEETVDARQTVCGIPRHNSTNPVKIFTEAVVGRSLWLFHEMGRGLGTDTALMSLSLYR